METYLIQGEKSVTSMTSAQEDASHSSNSLVQRSEHPSPPEHARFLDLKPLPHSEEQSDHSDQGENLIPDPGTMLLETKAADVFGQFGRLLQNWLSTSCPTHSKCWCWISSIPSPAPHAKITQFGAGAPFWPGSPLTMLSAVGHLQIPAVAAWSSVGRQRAVTFPFPADAVISRWLHTPVWIGKVTLETGRPDAPGAINLKKWFLLYHVTHMDNETFDLLTNI